MYGKLIIDFEGLWNLQNLILPEKKNFYKQLYSLRKARPRTSAWYYLYVEATRRNLILPDLPGLGGCFQLAMS